MQGLLKSLFCCNKKTKPHSYYRYVFGVCRANLAWIVKVARVKLISLTSADFNWCMVGVASARPAAISASHFFRPIRNNAETQTTVGGPFKPCFNGTWFTYKTHAWFDLFFKQTCVSYKSKRRQACSVGLSWPYYEDKFLGAGNRREKETKHVEYRLLWSCNSWAYEKTNM